MSKLNFSSLKLRSAINKISLAKNFIIDLVFPVVCLGCGQSDTWLCQKCLAAIPLRLARHCPFCEKPTIAGEVCPDCHISHYLNGAFSFVPYSNPTIQELIHAWKYQGLSGLTEVIGLIMLLAMAKNKKSLGLLNPDKSILLTPVPLHPKKLKQRGFNQSELLARFLSQQLGFCLEPTVARQSPTASQASLPRLDRFFNVRDSFAINHSGDKIKNKNIILVDDVITTASTCEAIAKTLKQAGASQVWALTIAYGHPIQS